MTGLMAGYAVAIAAILVAATAAFTIVHNVSRLDTLDEQPSVEETGKKAAA